MNHPSRRALVGGALASLALPSLASAQPARAATGPGGTVPSPPSLSARPNFVVVLADDLGWGELGCQGQRLIHTPNLDRLAAEGVRFEAAYSGAPLCAPSRSALLTGLHAGHGTVRENPEGGTQHSLTEADLTFAELLQLAGYRTACIGKWGFGPETPGQPSHPNRRGFGSFLGYIEHRHAHQYYPSYLWDNGDRLDLDGTVYAPDLFLERAVEFVRDPAERPFLLYFASTLPHSPSVVAGGAGRYQDEPWSGPNRRHAAQVSRLDADVATLVRALVDSGRADRTVVLFTSDNGPHSEKGVTPELFRGSGPFRGDKRDLYEGGIRVPFLVWSPGLPARVESTPVASWDVLPTLADLAGVPVPARLDGRSLAGLLRGGPPPERGYFVWNRPRKIQAIRRGRWKVIRFAPGIAGAGPGGRVELYDLDADQGERTDLSARWPVFTRAMLGELDRAIGPDPRLPYGLRIDGDGERLTVTLHNGSAVTWHEVRLELEPPQGERVRGPEVAGVPPGAAWSADFPPVTGGRVWATFRAQGRRHTFRRRIRLPSPERRAQR
ncbi:arylsulfatase [Nonomuraea sp. NPDC050328]|uniref:arylsulfatase n=1 Tax=Nonomuraea sp. NPDC050328 TaxID=3364361 RepID=UPI00378B74CA